MRSVLRYVVFALAFVFAMAIVRPASAQDFANAKWTPLTKNGIPIGDTTADVAASTQDIVGDAQNPAAYIYQDATYFYFRVRVNGQPIPAPATDLAAVGWGCAIDTNGALDDYEFLAVANGVEPSGPGGAPDAVEWVWNQNTTTAGSISEPADVVVASFQRSVHARVVPAGTSFGGDPDYFVEWAIPLTTIRAGADGGGAPGVAAGTSLRFACGTSLDARSIGIDPVCPKTNAQCTLADAWSDAIPCGASSCGVDTDGDGVFDHVETFLGTDPTKKDSDSDGIDDNIELSATGGAGPFRPIDTDGDGTIDAKDTDSDNDCLVDLSEDTTTWRDPALPNVKVSDNCPDFVPICLGGKCVACAVNFVADAGPQGDAGPARCPRATSPKCNTEGPLLGRCSECGPGEVSLCKVPAGFCDPTFGICAGCNGDYKTSTSVSCPDSASPYCHVTGPDKGRCGRCTSEADCAGAGHAGTHCDIVAGTCIKPIDAGVDGGPRRRDAGLEAIDGDGPEQFPIRPGDDEGDGGGCSVARGTHVPFIVLALALAVLALVRRRR
jgi:hypothetical protein